MAGDCGCRARGFVLAGSDASVPVGGPPQSLFEREAWGPAQTGSGLRGIDLQEPRFVRELTACEQPCFQSAKTGDMLPDGTVLLWRSDMDRMGLNALREWLRQNAVESNSVIAFGDVPARLGTLLEEEYNLRLECSRELPVAQNITRPSRRNEVTSRAFLEERPSV